ncbi:MAG: sporulation membrane protein YtaF [Bacillota bacterium]
MTLWTVILFALAVSLDGLGVGISYGVRRVSVPWKSLVVICLTSTVAITISMLFGQMLAAVISVQLAKRLGSLILIMVGSWVIIQTLSRREPGNETGNQPCQLFRLKISPLGIVIQILKEPMRADLDSSGVIDPRESLLLGFALAMDALGAGFGAAVAGFNIAVTPPFVGGFQLVFVLLGLWLGQRIACGSLSKKSGLIPGLILIILGLLKG